MEHRLVEDSYSSSRSPVRETTAASRNIISFTGWFGVPPPYLPHISVGSVASASDAM
jgi:hypothetical protein